MSKLPKIRGTGYSTPELTSGVWVFGPGFRGRRGLPVSFSRCRTKSSFPSGQPILVALRIWSCTADTTRLSFKNSFQRFPSKRDLHSSSRPESSIPAAYALALDQGHSHAFATSPARTGLSSTYRNAFQKVILIERAGEEAILPNMACEVLLDVLKSGEVVMEPTESLCQGVWEFRYGDVVDP